MPVIRLLGRVLVFVIAVAVLAFVFVNQASFSVNLPALEFRYWFGPGDRITSPSIPLYLFCVGAFLLGVLLMGLASLEVYGEIVGAMRRIRKERKAHEPQRRELEKVRAALAREREEHEPKARELAFKATELEHRGEELRREREAVAEQRSAVAQERAELAKDRADLSREHHELERAERELARSRDELVRERAARERALESREQALLAREERAPQRVPESRVAVAPTSVPAPDVPVVLPTALDEPSWDLVGQLDDDVAAVARMAQADPAEEADLGEVEGKATERVTSEPDD